MVEDPYKKVRRIIPPPDFVIGKTKYDRKLWKELEEKEIEEGLKEYYEAGVAQMVEPQFTRLKDTDSISVSRSRN